MKTGTDTKSSLTEGRYTEAAPQSAAAEVTTSSSNATVRMVSSSKTEGTIVVRVSSTGLSGSKLDPRTA